MNNLKNPYFLEVAESIKWNSIIFIKSPSFLQADFIKFMSQKFTDISNVSPLAKCLPGMTLEMYINFLIKWDNYKELKFTKKTIEQALSNTSQSEYFYVHLLLHPSRIIVATLTQNMLKDPSLYRILNLGSSLMKKKYIIFVEDFVHEKLKQYKLIDFSAVPREKNTYPLKILEGISTKSEKIILFSIENVIFFESVNSIIYAQLKTERVRIKATLEHLEKSLSGTFFRSHRCYLANLTYLSELIKATKASYEISLGDYNVPLSKYRLKKFKNFVQNKDRY